MITLAARASGELAQTSLGETDILRLAVVLRQASKGAAFLRCKACGHAWEMPVKGV